jgi:hypothetical protein
MAMVSMLDKAERLCYVLKNLNKGGCDMGDEPENIPLPDPDKRPDAHEGVQGDLVVPLGDTPPAPHGPGPLRDQVIAVLNNVFGSVSSHMNMVFQNMPTAALHKKITKNGVTASNLPQIFDGIDSYIKQTVFAIRRNPQLVPDAIDLQNIKQAFMALRLIQSELNDIADTYGQPRNGSARLMPKPYRDQDEKGHNKRITALDVGAVLDGRAGRNAQLSASEQETLRGLSADVGLFSLIAAHILGAQVTGFTLEEQEHLNKHMKHQDIAKLMAVTPPQPWADAMKRLKISMPSADTEKLRIIS